jgi:T5orf172 domain
VLTDDQVRLLAKLGLKPEQVFDARGMQRSQFLVQAEMQSKVAFAPHAPCKLGHAFWLGTGHCVECCSPVGLSQWRKHHEDGWVYIASSNHLRLHKIGATTNVTSERMRQLNEGYAGAKDWTLTYRRKFRSHGRVEDGARASLRRFAIKKDYLHRGKRTKAGEVIDCPYEKIRAAIEAFAADAIDEVFDLFKTRLRFP